MSVLNYELALESNLINHLEIDLEDYQDTLKKALAGTITKNIANLLVANNNELMEHLEELYKERTVYPDEDKLTEIITTIQKIIPQVENEKVKSSLLEVLETLKKYSKYAGFKYPEYKRPNAKTSELSKTPPSHEELMSHARSAVDALLEDAKQVGYKQHKQPTFEELIREIELETLKRIKERKEKKVDRASSQAKYPSKGYTEAEISAIKGYEKHKAELQTQELSGKHKQTRAEREEGASRRGASAIISGSN